MTTVIVVDDDRDAAEDFARLIRQRTGLTVSVFDHPEAARAAVGDGGVAVAVLDQQMPLTTGTELYKRLKIVDARVRAILLTGEATSGEVGLALNQGFSRYVHKPNALHELADAVRHEYIEYQNSLLLEVSADQPELFKRRRGFPWGSTLRYQFVALQILDEQFVREEDWREILTIQAGQTQEVTVSRGESWTLELDEEVNTKIGAAFSLTAKQIMGLTTSLQSEVSQRLRASRATSATAATETKQTFQLPEEPADINQVHVRARRVQQAPVLVSTRLEVMEECGCCGRPNLLTIRAFAATGSVALRHVDQLSDGSTKIIELGRAGAAG